MANETTETIEQQSAEAKPATGKSRQAKSDAASYWSVGRRKTAVARVKMALGKGDVVVNDKPLEEFASQPTEKAKILAALSLTDRLDSFDISVKVAGGGQTSQLDAISLGIARALLQHDATLRQSLRQANLLTRDGRAKERKKYGLKRARKKPQFSKR